MGRFLYCTYFSDDFNWLFINCIFTGKLLHSEFDNRMGKHCWQLVQNRRSELYLFILREHKLFLVGISGTPNDPNPDKAFAKLEHVPLFSDNGFLNPSITILGSVFRNIAASNSISETVIYFRFKS